MVPVKSDIELLLEWLVEAADSVSIERNGKQWYISLIDGAHEINGNDPTLFSALMQVAEEIKADKYLPPDPVGIDIQLLD